jgi:hypothetical protein
MQCDERGNGCDESDGMRLTPKRVQRMQYAMNATTGATNAQLGQVLEILPRGAACR